ncbi:MAG: HepT-like ribonuclease domain-containing protein [candidate division WOR-3 bacterium]
MRNRLIHAYFDIDLDIVWQTITDEIPMLIAELEKVVNK